MKRFALGSYVLILLSCSPGMQPGAGEQGDSVRQRLQERRQQESPATATGAIAVPGDYSFTTEHAGLKRKYRIHVPAGYDPAKPAPLLFAFHGGGGDMDHHADDANYGHISLSDRENFILVVPNGFSRLRSGKIATWNAGHCCAAARDSNADDVGFIRRILAEVSARLNVDRNRIYATGMSNGGMMAYRLACEMSDVFKAIAAVAGTDNTRSCAPENPVSILHIHAKNDSRVLFTGGAGPDAVDRSLVADFTSVPDTIAKWVRLNGCAAGPTRILEKSGAYCEVYVSCRDGAEVQLCVTETGGHSWPGAMKAREPASQAISANEVMWEFFKRL